MALEPGPRLVRSMPYRQSPAMGEHTKMRIDEILSAGVMEPVTRKSVVFVFEKDGTLRLCVD